MCEVFLTEGMPFGSPIIIQHYKMNLASLSHKSHAVRKFNSSQFEKKIERLSELYGKNKIIPEKYKLQILVALSYFPELKDTHIKFKEAKISTTLNARPAISSLLFDKRSKRKYIVRINNTSKESAVTIDEVPFNASIGLLGHEFSHFADYMDRGIMGMLRRAYAYTKTGLKARFEKEIDMHTIKRGLGWQLYDWAYYVLHHSEASEKYKAFKARTYLQPAEIRKHLDSSGTNPPIRKTY